MSTLSDYIESRRRVVALQVIFTETLGMISTEQRAALEKRLEEQSNCTTFEFTEGFVGWLTLPEPESKKKARSK